MFRPFGRAFVAGLALAGLLLSPLAAEAASKPKNPVPTAGISIDQTNAALVVGGSFGGGTLKFNGKQYAFHVGGVTLGGMGAARIRTSGAVYDLKRLQDFPGTYVVAQGGASAGDIGTNTIWLRNTKGVYIKLTGSSVGLMLSGGVGSMVIDWK